MTVQDTVCSFENLYKSMRVCKRSVGWKDSVIGWTRNGLSNCIKLKDSLHDVAKQAITKRCRDEWAKEHVFKIIDSFDGDRGMGLGSQVTQLIQLSVLDDLDHFIKEKLKVQHYIRYMDDMIIISNNKEELIRIKHFVDIELSKIGLKLNQKKTQIFKIKQGVKFLGFKFVLLPSGKVIRLVLKSNILRRKRKIVSFMGRVVSTHGKISDLDESFRSWLSHLEHGNCYKVSIRMTSYYLNRRSQVYEILKQG